MRLSELKKSYYLIWVLAVVLLAVLWHGSESRAGEAGEVFVADMSSFVERNKPVVAGSRTLFTDRRVAFEGHIVQGPSPQKVDYLKEAFAVTRIYPVPEVAHSLFVEIAPGQVIPVYVARPVVESELAGAIDGERRYRLAGIHLYNYSKGPAIVVDRVEALGDE
ncbi:MAG: hypothetical protein P8101_04935 [Candidatus Thiodiazotropha sp.]